MSPRWSCGAQLPHAQVEQLARELDAIERVGEDEDRDLRDDVDGEDPAAEARAMTVEHLRVDEALREADSEEADGHEDDAEERVHRAQVRALRAGVDREAQHEVRRVE